MFASDVAHPKALDQREVMDLILTVYFHLSEGGTWDAAICQRFI